MLKAVIFDMDGVLIDSEPLHARAAVLSLKEYNVDINIEYCYNFIGTTTKAMFQTMINDFKIDVSLEQLLETNSRIINELHQVEGYIGIEGTKELLKDLHDNGIKLAVASSSPYDLIVEVTTELGIIQYFDKLVSGANVKHPKPAPDVFLKAMEELDVKAKDCLVIEDSMNGVIAADAAQIKSIGYINPNSGKQDLSKASILIESFKNIDYQFMVNEYNRSYGIPVTISETERLIIRELSVEDMKHMYQIYHNPEVKQYIDDIDDYLEIEIEKHKAYIKNVYGFYGYGLWGVFSKEDRTLIGRCGIQNRIIDGNSEIELGYLLDQKHWGYGYALECTKEILKYAFEELLMTRIVAVIDKDNLRSIQVASRLGMTIEKEIVMKNRDCYLYVITNKQYANTLS